MCLRREAIQGQIDYLSDVTKDLQKQLLAKDGAVQKAVGAAGLKYDVAVSRLNRRSQARSREGKVMPLPVFEKDELGKIAEITTRNKDARLLGAKSTHADSLTNSAHSSRAVYFLVND
jgi:hypothetical protein